jgi:hypothetical protein
MPIFFVVMMKQRPDGAQIAAAAQRVGDIPYFGCGKHDPCDEGEEDCGSKNPQDFFHGANPSERI